MQIFLYQGHLQWFTGTIFLLGTKKWSSIAQGDQLNHMMKFSSWAGLDHELKSHEAHFTLSCFDNEIVGAF